MKLFKMITALALAAAMVLSCVPAALADAENVLLGYAKAIVIFEKHANGIFDNESIFSGRVLDNAGSDSSDWLAVGVSRLGLEEDYAAYYEAWEADIKERYESSGGLDRAKATEWHRAALTALAMGADPTDIGGIDLIADGVYGRDENNSPDRQGLNGWIWSLIALDSLDWQTPEGALFDREYIINKLLSAQLADGGFSVAESPDAGDIDITAMTLQALAPYTKDERVKRAADKALDFLAEEIKGADDITCESLAQTVCALCCLGGDLTAEGRFDNSDDPLDKLMSFSRNDGGFAHLMGDEKSSEVASAQTLIALAAVIRSSKGLRSIYDFGKEPQLTQNSPPVTLPQICQSKSLNTGGKGYVYDVENGREYIIKKSDGKKNAPHKGQLKRVRSTAAVITAAVGAVIAIRRKRA